MNLGQPPPAAPPAVEPKSEMETEETTHTPPQEKIHPPGSSKVVYLFNLPKDLPNEDEIIYFGQKFGEVEKVLYLMHKGCGLLQFETIDEAKRCIDFLKTDPYRIGQYTIKGDFSNKQEIESKRSTRPGDRDRRRGEDASRQGYSSRPPRSSRDFREPGRPGERFDQPPDRRNMFQGAGRVVNMAVRIEPDGTITPLADRLPVSLFRGDDRDRPPFFDDYRRRERSRSPGRYGGRDYYRGPSPPRRPRSVLLTCFGLPPTMTPTQIANFFGVYGDVYRAKISNRNKNQCWVEMASRDCAERVLHFLRNVRIRGRYLTIDYSTVGELRPASKDNENDKEFRDERRRHRYNFRNVEKFVKHLVPPTKTLFVSNIPKEITTEDIEKEFEVSNVEFLRDSEEKRRKMAFVPCNSIEHAIEVLSKQHGTKMQGSTICISFSKKHYEEHQGTRQRSRDGRKTPQFQFVNLR